MADEDQGPGGRRLGAGAPDPGRDPQERARHRGGGHRLRSVHGAREDQGDQPRRADARRRDAAHGRAHVPGQPDAAATDAGGDGLLADRARRRDHAQGAGARRGRLRLQAARSTWPARCAISAKRSSRKIRIAAACARGGALGAAPVRRRRPSIRPMPSCRPTPRQRMLRTTDRIIAIGASTGGTEAIREVLTGLPADCPAIVIAQHIPAAFSAPFAQRMDALCRAVGVRAGRTDSTSCRATSTSRPAAATCWWNATARVIAAASTTDRRSIAHCPSVDVLFRSVAQKVGTERRGRDPHRHGRRRRARPAWKCATPARRPSRRTRPAAWCGACPARR